MSARGPRRDGMNRKKMEVNREPFISLSVR
jgi:hypothetical protein